MTEPLGVTPDGRTVISFFALVDRHGVPLECLVQWASERRDLVLGWHDFLRRAGRAGWNMGRLHERCHGLVRDAFGAAYAAAWRERVDA